VIVPGSIDTRTGGYGYDRRIVSGLRDRGWSVVVRELDASFPQPGATALEHAASVLGAVSDGSIALVDGLALGAMPALIERAHERLRLVALIHHPLAAETGLDRDTAARLEASERRALAAVDRVVVTSGATADTLKHYGVSRDRMAVVEPGTDRAPLARGSSTETIELLSVAAIVPRKGHEILIRALAATAAKNWRLTCVGSLDREPRAVERVRDVLRAEGLDDRVTLAGEADERAVSEYYDRADAFVLPTFYEGYGMAVAEALARGLPVISTPTGAIPELVTDNAGVLVPPGDSQALAAVLSRLVGDRAFRAELAAGARRVRDRLPTWEDAAGKMAEILERLQR
jgi:glycosyltransferase involved in cell wall biosynthesis